MAYTRKFLILKKELGNMRATGLKGHGKLEVKGARGLLTVSIENAKVNDVYGLDLLSSDKSNEIRNLGKIYTDESGRGKGEFSFMQKDFKLEDMIGVLISKDENVFLGGYIHREDGRIENYLKSMARLATVEELEVEVVEEPEEVEEIQEVEEVEEVKETEIVAETIEEAEVLIEDIQAEEEIYEEYTIVEEIYETPTEEEIVEEVVVEEEIIQEEITQEEIKPEPKYDSIDTIKKLNQKDQTTNYVLNILRYFPYLDPFKNNLRGYNWWVVDLDRENEYRSFLPYFSYLTGGNNKEAYNGESITCTQLMDKYQHYIFGLYNENEEVKYFVYGVPGNFSMNEHPNGGAHGFNTWYEGRNGVGYWMIYIDPMTGKPVYPFNPMIPIK